MWAALGASVAPALATSGWSREALAQAATASAPLPISAATSAAGLSAATSAAGPGAASRAGAPSENELPEVSGIRPVRAGVIAGVGFPHPLAIEALVEFSGLVAVGAEYAALPAVTIDGVRTSLWSLAADVRVFPFRGAFYVGLRAGRQHVEATTTVSLMSFGSATEVLDLDTWFLNPSVGFLWTSREGFTFGLELGVQIPISPSTSSTLPLALYPAAAPTIHTLGSSALPTIDLLRIGLLL